MRKIIPNIFGSIICKTPFIYITTISKKIVSEEKLKLYTYKKMIK
ncbi:UNVERIFIED_ORG: hypothetical protein QQG_5169 [Clostridioides difficile Y384]|nr:Hypothetical protein EfmE4453_2501 [Enterococcus faecium E4453]MBK4749844.1 hypothetical protein [Enterococcus faecium]MBK4800759.1 hypothetical protein [Enterococcus faecium]MBK4854499.1 hypothetical protein [Enterococcus faecium]